MRLTSVLLLILLVIQNPQKLPNDFSELRKLSMEELQLKMQAHNGWGLHRMERWDFRQETGKLVFTLPGGLIAVAPAQIIGTFNNEDQTWLWAWANESIQPDLVKDALKLQKYGQEHKIEILTKRKWTGKRDDALEMTAVAVKLLDKQGAYIGSAGSTDVYFAFGKVVVSKP